jgi:hypothetical protein
MAWKLIVKSATAAAMIPARMKIHQEYGDSVSKILQPLVHGIPCNRKCNER